MDATIELPCWPAPANCLRVRLCSSCDTTPLAHHAPTADLPRNEHIYEPNETVCVQCDGGFKYLGDDISEQLEIIGAAFKILRHVRRKRTCACCDRNRCKQWYDFPRQQLFSTIDWMISDLREHIAQIGPGSMSLSLAVPMSEYIAAARSPPLLPPMNRKLLRPNATERHARSAALLSISAIALLQYSSKACH
jgi:hypothetical protein